MDFFNKHLFTRQTYDSLFGAPPAVKGYVCGDTIAGKYCVTGSLSGGLNSDVYTATDTLAGEKVVIKYVKGDPFNEKTLRNQNLAIKEFRKWSAIPMCDKILPAYDFFYDERIQKYALVTPYIEKTHPYGLSLRDLLDNGYTFCVEDVEHLFREVYTAIRYIKEKIGITYAHCDFKPDNFFVVCGSDVEFSRCSIMLADCGSYSVDVRYIGKYQKDLSAFFDLTERERDVVMLLETGEVLCPDYRNGKTDFCKFVRDVTNNIKGRSILDFGGYFGEVPIPDAKDTPLRKLIAAYNDFTVGEGKNTIVGIKRDKRLTNRFNRTAEEYIADTSDNVLPMFLCLKDSCAVGNYKDAEKRCGYLYAMCRNSVPDSVKRFCEYSSDFGNEIVIRNAVALFHITDLYEASEEELYGLCALFVKIDVNKCFNFSWMAEAVMLCEYMAFEKENSALIGAMCRKADEISTDDRDSIQLKNDKKLFCSVFNCMNESSESVRREYAKECAFLALGEPYNMHYLFFAAKTLMLSSEITAAQVFCSVFVNVTNQIIKHDLPVSMESLMVHGVICLYWLTAFPAGRDARYTENLKEMTEKYFAMGGNSSCGTKIFEKLCIHVQNELFAEYEDCDIMDYIDKVNEIIGSQNCGVFRLKQYYIGLLSSLAKSCVADLEALMKKFFSQKLFLDKEDMESFDDLMKVLEWVDPNVSKLSAYRAWMEFKRGNREQATALFEDTNIKCIFAIAGNPYFKTGDEDRLIATDVLTARNNIISRENSHKLNADYGDIINTIKSMD